MLGCAWEGESVSDADITLVYFLSRDDGDDHNMSKGEGDGRCHS